MIKFKKTLSWVLLTAGFILAGWAANDYYRSQVKTTPNPISAVKPRPLEKYTIENLSKNPAPESEIKTEQVLKNYPDFTSYLFSFSFDPAFSGKTEKKVTGVMNVPKGQGPFPLVVMFRGYVDQKIYTSGTGTARMAEYLAKNGYITIAPDFLGYGGSDAEAENIFESRFQTYTTALTLLNSLNALKTRSLKAGSNSINLEASDSINIADVADAGNIFIWGHSNGGQVALTVLEITGMDYPTVLWAPVSKPFPYSVLYYTDESEDKGRLIRRELAKFEEDYDVDKFSLTNYFDKIKASILILQGTADDAVPISWTNALAKTLLSTNPDLNYVRYSGADHNLQPSWNAAAAATLDFYSKHLTKN